MSAMLWMAQKIYIDALSSLIYSDRAKYHIINWFYEHSTVHVMIAVEIITYRFYEDSGKFMGIPAGSMQLGQ